MRFAVTAANQNSSKVEFAKIDANRTDEHPGLLLDLMAKRVDGLHVTGLFTQDEIARAVPALDGFRDLANTEPFGAMLGMPLYEIGDSNDRTPFFDSGDENRLRYREAFGFDPHQRLWDVLRPMAGDLEITFAREGDRVYNPGNVRWYDPGQGGLKAHAGNEFVEIAGAGALSHLLTESPVRDHMSYFVVLREPDIGGDLSVYDLLWVDRPPELDHWDGMARDDSRFDAMACLRHQPKPGDLTIFGGGWRYHRVDPVGGEVPRMTYGGFSNVSHDGHRLYMWC